MLLSIGERIALLRRLRGWTQMDLAIHMQTDKTYISRLETNSVGSVKSDMLIKFAQLFEVSADYILGLTDELPLDDAQEKDLFDAEMTEIQKRREAKTKGQEKQGE